MFPFVHQINPAGWFHLVFFGLLIPAMVVNQAIKFRDLQKPLPDRLRYFQSTTLTLIMFGAISLWVARAFPPWRAILAGAAMLAIAIVVMRPRWRRTVERRARVVHLFMPANASERAWWIIVAVLAGLSEEITWRGVQAGLARSLTGSVVIAVLFCSITFAIAHMIQGWKSAAVIVVFALSFHTLVLLSGSLYVAMAVHVTYDVVAGISYGRLGKELGYSLEPDAEVANKLVS